MAAHIGLRGLICACFALTVLSGCRPSLPATQALPTSEPSPTSRETPSLSPSIDTDVTPDVPYTRERALDIYAPASRGNWPVVVLLHGAKATKTSIKGLALAIAGQGAVVFVPTYRSDAPLPDEITRGPEDAACAIRFAKAYAPDYGGDASRTILVGHSNGGAFAVLMGLAGDDFVGDCLLAGGSALPDVVVGLDGAYDFIRYIPPSSLEGAPAQEWLTISPFSHVAQQPPRDAVEFRLFVGLEEELLRNAQAMRDSLAAAGYQVSLTQIPGVDHAQMASGYLPETVSSIAELLHR